MGLSIARAARTIALTSVVGVLCVPAVAGAALDIHHQSTSVNEASGGDGVISPGDSLQVYETLFSSEPGADPTGLTGTLSTSTPGVTVPQPAASFPTLAFAGTSTNTTPFGVQLDSGLECGQVARFSVGITADQGSASVPFARTGYVATLACGGGAVGVEQPAAPRVTRTATGGCPPRRPAQRRRGTGCAG